MSILTTGISAPAVSLLIDGVAQSALAGANSFLMISSDDRPFDSTLSDFILDRQTTGFSITGINALMVRSIDFLFIPLNIYPTADNFTITDDGANTDLITLTAQTSVDETAYAAILQASLDAQAAWGAPWAVTVSIFGPVLAPISVRFTVIANGALPVRITTAPYKFSRISGLFPNTTLAASIIGDFTTLNGSDYVDIVSDELTRDSPPSFNSNGKPTNTIARVYIRTLWAGSQNRSTIEFDHVSVSNRLLYINPNRRIEQIDLRLQDMDGEILFVPENLGLGNLRYGLSIVLRWA